mmetsp:Transcript_17572/g.49659  ORF Transcript_17572/g.49659 Transcript_17572/m.49659 type:complete len:99 (+) Transcript_17572:11848-12144(+)
MHWSTGHATSLNGRPHGQCKGNRNIHDGTQVFGNIAGKNSKLRKNPSKGPGGLVGGNGTTAHAPSSGVGPWNIKILFARACLCISIQFRHQTAVHREV